jgi:DNA mismatch repair protein MutS2
MRIYPETALHQLEFEQIKSILHGYCGTDESRERAKGLSISIDKDAILLALRQTDEYLQLLKHQQSVPGDFGTNLSKEIRMLEIPGAVCSERDLMEIRKLLDATGLLFKWFTVERKQAYRNLYALIGELSYEEGIVRLINDVLDESGQVRDHASTTLRNIRADLHTSRHALRRAFDQILRKLQKQGYVAEIEESYLNGRRVIAIFSEHKRAVKGILHGETDSRRIVFIEPEETIELNNAVFSLERDERQEIYRILKSLTADLSKYAHVIKAYYVLIGHMDFIRAKAKLAQSIQACLPQITDEKSIHLKEAYHPLLLLQNKASNKPTIPLNLSLHHKYHLLIISGPNAGGKTVTLKTIGLLQIMVQAGLLVPVHEHSSFYIFKQLMIHIGDTQSIEQNLSTYSSHLLHMKYFMEHADANTLFFIDELGSGSDPNLGGAFAEVILKELSEKKSFGIVTTHYLNLKLMADHTPGILNAAMGFDEETMLPQYKLIVGKPGSSYTFAIAERIGLSKRLTDAAKQLINQNHYRLDHLLNKTQQQLDKISEKEKTLHRLIQENKTLQHRLENELNREQHRQQIEILKHKNKAQEQKWVELKDLERKIKAILHEWKRAEDKNKAIQQMQVLLYGQKQKNQPTKKERLILDQYEETGGEIEIGNEVRSIHNRKVGIVKEIRGKQVLVQIGNLPISIKKEDLVRVVKKKE